MSERDIKPENSPADENHYRDELRKLKVPLLDHISELADVCDAPRRELNAHAGATGTMIAQLQIASFRLGRESVATTAQRPRAKSETTERIVERLSEVCEHRAVEEFRYSEAVWDAVSELKRLAGKAEQLRVIARLVSSIFFHGDFKAETVNERALVAALGAAGYWAKSEDDLMRIVGDGSSSPADVAIPVGVKDVGNLSAGLLTIADMIDRGEKLSSSWVALLRNADTALKELRGDVEGLTLRANDERRRPEGLHGQLGVALKEVELVRTRVADIADNVCGMQECAPTIDLLDRIEAKASGLEFELAEYRRLEQGCPDCIAGTHERRLLDSDGVLSSVSGKPGRWGHGFDDYHWFCADAGAIAENKRLAGEVESRDLRILGLIGLAEQLLDAVEAKGYEMSARALGELRLHLVELKGEETPATPPPADPECQHLRTHRVDRFMVCDDCGESEPCL